VKIKFVAPFILLAVLFSVSSASANVGREINAGNILKGGPYYVLSEHGVPNGMPCEWYAYATTVGLDYCDHPGIDISANYENLYAATDGVVEFAGADAAYWPNHVDIRVTSERYKGELHIYGHMSQVFVEPGQTVKKGEVLGVSGEAGGAPHVHFERRTAPNAQCPGGCAIDPEPPLHSGQGTS
jgi:murein DD-endopeptidase MepM/ murein hydrolase activator NlpD